MEVVSSSWWTCRSCSDPSYSSFVCCMCYLIEKMLKQEVDTTRRVNLVLTKNTYVV